MHAYDVAMADRNAAEGWLVKRYENHFVLSCMGANVRLEIKHEQVGDRVELESLAKVGEGRALLFGTTRIGPLRAAVDPGGRLCLRGTYWDGWGESGPEAFAVSVIDSLARLTSETAFESEPYDAAPLDVRVSGADSPIFHPEMPGGVEAINTWLGELKLRHIQTGAIEWQVQAFGKTEIGYTIKLNLFGKILIALSFGAPNSSIVVDEELVQTLLRANYASGLAKQTLVVFSEGSKDAPMASVEWPAAAVRNAEALRSLVTAMTEYLDVLWTSRHVFFVPT
jgi:hypothetical protein